MTSYAMPSDVGMTCVVDLAHRMHVGFREGLMKGAIWVGPEDVKAGSTS